ncbi:MAG: TetR/AcrR family transcriptional regulator [Ruminococcus sp.]|nr:TetR/AcrR family transcriptional regulator [Ruminococcus sp.]
MGKLDTNKRKKRESLFNTAFELFTTKGMSKTSISDIVDKAGVAKGTFYLYFKDKYDIRNKLISHKSSELFLKAADGLKKLKHPTFEEKIIFLIDHIIDQLNDNKSLLILISKNLSWGIFRDALSSPTNSGDVDFKKIYDKMLEQTDDIFKDPEVMLFMIAELVGSTCYSVILYSEPVDLKTYKPYLFESVHNIIEANKIGKKEE